jgi:ubiquinone/menaquinone biosynthesis C-methylase UbiE
MKQGNTKKQTFDTYINSVNLSQLFKKLGATNPEPLAKTVQHFTLKEAEKRDKIVLNYFGEAGVQRIVESVTEQLKTTTLRKGSKILDVGAGSGFFTAQIAKRIPQAKFYAMDVTPAMLQTLNKKKLGITTFLGIAENIEGSISEAQAYGEIPAKFDAAFSTLTLHHSVEPATVFNSLKNVLKKNGKAIVLDLCEHTFTEFKTEMQDVHLGFNLEAIRKTAQQYFMNVTVAKMPGICCSSSGRSAELFTATLSMV